MGTQIVINKAMGVVWDEARRCIGSISQAPCCVCGDTQNDVVGHGSGKRGGARRCEEKRE